MADLSKDRGLRLGPGEHHIREWVLDNSAAQTVYKGQPMIIDNSEDTVYLRGWIDATALTSSDRFVGINASAQVDVATTDTETDNKVDVIMSGLVGFPTSTVTDADAGEMATMTDSSLVVAGSGAGANNLEIGYVAYVEDSYVYVALNGRCGGAPTLCT